MRSDDAELICRMRAGETGAFAELVNRYRDMLCGLAYHYLGNFEDAQDAAQEALIHAFLHIQELRAPEKFAPWLRRSAVNRCANLLRSRGRRLLSWEALAEETPERAEVRTLHGHSARPDATFEPLALRLEVQKALRLLSEKTRLTVILFYIGGYSHAEIAAFLEIPVNTVRSRLQHAKRQLREEMISMVSEVLNEGKPDPQFTRRVVEEAMRRGTEAQLACRTGDAIHHYDEALQALEQWEPGEERQRLQMEALWKKGKAVEPVHRGEVSAVRFLEQSLAIAESLGDRKSQADKLLALGNAYYNSNEASMCQKVREYYEKALELYRDLEDAVGQAHCLLALGNDVLWNGAAQGRDIIEQARALFEKASNPEGIAFCRAFLRLLSEVGEERFLHLIGRRFGFDGLEQSAGRTTFLHGHTNTSYTCDGSPEQQALGIHSPLEQVSHLRTFLDTAVPVGGSWTGDTCSHSLQPLQATVTVKSDSERVTVPAGTFADCLLMEQVTTESDLPDPAPERKKESNRRHLCGRRLAWYAPGVGLVQLHVLRADGAEARIQLQEYTVLEGGRDYFPLADGNIWAYGWADLPDAYVAREVYRATSQVGTQWHLEHFSFAYRK